MLKFKELQAMYRKMSPAEIEAYGTIKFDGDLTDQSWRENVPSFVSNRDRDGNIDTIYADGQGRAGMMNPVTRFAHALPHSHGNIYAHQITRNDIILLHIQGGSSKIAEHFNHHHIGGSGWYVSDSHGNKI
jgi:hypothetical protein